MQQNDYHEFAEVLTEQYNGFALATEDFFPLEQEFVHEYLIKMFQEEDVDFFMDDDFARGVFAGAIYAVYLMTREDDPEETDEDEV